MAGEGSVMVTNEQTRKKDAETYLPHVLPAGATRGDELVKAGLSLHFYVPEPL